jgi:hypothetical protein
VFFSLDRPVADTSSALNGLMTGTTQGPEVGQAGHLNSKNIGGTMSKGIWSGAFAAATVCLAVGVAAAQAPQGSESSSSAAKSITVTGPSTGAVGATLNFSASAAGCTPSATWNWNVAGGTVQGSSTGASIAVSYAAAGSKTISQNVVGVADAARSTSEAAAETQQSAQSLEQMAARLKELVGQFKYEEPRARSAAA